MGLRQNAVNQKYVLRIQLTARKGRQAKKKFHAVDVDEVNLLRN